METKQDSLNCRFLFIIVILITFFIPKSYAQNPLADSSRLLNPQQIEQSSESTDTVAYYYEPYPMKRGSMMIQLGGSFTLLPLPVVENEYPAPALDVQFKYGLNHNFILDVSFSTNYFSNLFHTGVQWNTNIDRFSLGIANHLGGFYGFINTTGQFDENSATAFYILPIIRMGYRLPKFSISVSLAASYIFNSYNKVSGLTAEGPQQKINDIFCTIAIEQPFLKHSLLSVGFSLNYARSPYQSWMLYNTLDQYLFLPEFFFSFQL